MRYAIPVERANFPEEWKRKVRTTTDDHGGSAAGGRLGQPKGSGRTAQGTSQTNTIHSKITGNCMDTGAWGAKDNLFQALPGHGGQTPITAGNTRGGTTTEGPFQQADNHHLAIGKWDGMMRAIQKSRH